MIKHTLLKLFTLVLVTVDSLVNKDPERVILDRYSPNWSLNLSHLTTWSMILLQYCRVCLDWLKKLSLLNMSNIPFLNSLTNTEGDFSIKKCKTSLDDSKNIKFFSDLSSITLNKGSIYSLVLDTKKII